MSGWGRERAARDARIEAGRAHAAGKVVTAADVVALLEAILQPGDRVCLEGDNQKQADCLARGLSQCDPARVHDLHMVQSGIVLPEHLDIFEQGIAKRLDYSYSGPQGARIARMLYGGQIELGAVHTYLELFARYFVDLTPNVALIAGVSADRDGNLYTGPNTEDTPTVVEATAFKNGVVVAQVNEIVDRVPRVDIPGDRIDFVVEADRPFYVEPLFTRDPAAMTETQILMAMMAIKGIYAEYGIRRLNHGIGFGTAAIELLLPTYAERLGLKGQIATHWALNPHPTLIPAIESGWVTQIHCFGSEVGMDRYIRERSDIFFTGADGSLRSNRAFCQTAGLYACDLFIGSTLQIDLAGHSSTVTQNRVAGFGGAPNMGSDPHGRRHPSDTWMKAGREAQVTGDPALMRGRKLVVQIVETFGEGLVPAFVEQLDALELARKIGLELAPVMVYADDVTHIVTEEGIANLLLCRTADEREQAIRGVAGYTEIGRGRDRAMVERLRQRGIVRRPEDLGIEPLDADRSLLAARSIKDLVHWSGGLYEPPAKFRNW
ncbi:UNVERIFIED_ORG: malonate decarboxylase alpha subunit [Methylobacterium sp. SuP10 SLI 274]|uniref:malonate decarboxylase subunit alpha n=1 Tax=Methylorubrum extorquens TaxID=408 RepID=UPI00209CC676|nr:malonate decarboxylase subunit alpha [Methylorubrum extorquens]MDF9862529.1 malonate decarboxylase alpha subunit [Methylorubrum pseudosasae]MDH6636142.1 malonate decarboxylase alpha subunit [Methylobacterium sp. SuP10 SLI 274]MDH6665316.1 malonate decarboxylase alpha subunit [Methylorubrum zatmanii]MCP1557243.1 malonate decarboxylase alpha subunit [Methylorubrum extorquens]MDF9790822.1 malonate decarboxylase alpha subunit [Methylorubrum extorquens]